MTTNSSIGLCAGDWVEVRSKEEILRTLDRDGRLDGMPFMPEMLEFCGKRLRVYKRAYKTCDFTKGMQARRLDGAVHLEGIRCDGIAHGGCQAGCLIFWKECWLKPVRSADISATDQSSEENRTHTAINGTCTNEDLRRATLAPQPDGSSPERIYVCQVTTVLDFTSPLAISEFRQYKEAYYSGNVQLRKLFPPLIFRAYQLAINRGRFLTPLLIWCYDAFQKLWGGVPYPNRRGKLPAGSKTPKGTSLSLQAGDWVRVKAYREILETIDYNGKNRGMIFSQEMVPYCGRVFKVLRRITRIVDEKSGRLLDLKNDCVVLEDVICNACYNEGLIYCPKATFPYWREIWLEQVTAVEAASSMHIGDGLSNP